MEKCNFGQIPGNVMEFILGAPNKFQRGQDFFT